jgi:glycerophosphoryl diester phosphodiesterase
MVAIVIAHRACPRHTAENSLRGIQCAADLGADVVEVDVRLTRDQVVVLMHDRTLRRTCGTWQTTAACSSSTLRSLRLSNGEEIPTLAEALVSLPSGMRMAIEVKVPRAVDLVMSEVRNQRRERDVLVWSKHAAAVQAVADRDPETESTLLCDTFSRWGTRAFLQRARACGAWGISARWQVVTPGFADQVHEMGLRLYSWCRVPPVPSPTMNLLDGLVSDWPAEARAAVIASGIL